MAHVVAVCQSQQRTDPKVDIGEGELRAGHGLVGDAHAGLSERQVSLLAIESIERANREHGITAVPGSFAENLTTAGLDLSTLKMGDRLRTGEAELVVAQLGKPPGAAHTYHYQGASILPREGVFCRVVRSGRVRHGDEIALISSSPPGALGHQNEAISSQGVLRDESNLRGRQCCLRSLDVLGRAWVGLSDRGEERACPF